MITTEEINLMQEIRVLHEKIRDMHRRGELLLSLRALGEYLDHWGLEVPQNDPWKRRRHP